MTFTFALTLNVESYPQKMHWYILMNILNSALYLV